MKVFTCNEFEGVYPVGSAAVIVAEDIETAAVELGIALGEAGIPQTVESKQLKELSLITSDVLILVDGDY